MLYVFKQTLFFFSFKERWSESDMLEKSFLQLYYYFFILFGFLSLTNPLINLVLFFSLVNFLYNSIILHNLIHLWFSFFLILENKVLSWCEILCCRYPKPNPGWEQLWIQTSLIMLRTVQSSKAKVMRNFLEKGNVSPPLHPKIITLSFCRRKSKPLKLEIWQNYSDKSN